MNQKLVQENERYTKALEIAQKGHIHQFEGENRWMVKSSDNKRWYVVSVGPDYEWCTCFDASVKQRICKHILSIAIHYTKVIEVK